jgi:hypothetical protein
METHRIELNQDQVDAIIINDLKYHLELNIDWGLQGRSNPKYQLIEALKVILNYYIADEEFKDYCSTLINDRAELITSNHK